MKENDMTDLTVKYFNSGMTGAPQIANNWGDLVTMLDACLVNGFALKAIDTLTLPMASPRPPSAPATPTGREQVVEIAGAEQPEYNGQFRVLDDHDHVHLRGDRHAGIARDDHDQPHGQGRAAGLGEAVLGDEQGRLPQQEPAVAAEHPADRQQPQDAELHDGWAKWANVGIVEPVGHRHHRRRAGPFDPNNPTQNWKQVGQPVGLVQVVPRAGPSTKATVTAAAAGATGC
jgi:hypothetical protein